MRGVDVGMDEYGCAAWGFMGADEEIYQEGRGVEGGEGRGGK